VERLPLPGGLTYILLQWSPSGSHQGVCDTHTPPSCWWCLSFCSCAWSFCPVSERSPVLLKGGTTTPPAMEGSLHLQVQGSCPPRNGESASSNGGGTSRNGGWGGGI